MEKTAVVTGASRGIGAAAARALAAQGCRVAVCCRQRRAEAGAVAAGIRAAGGTALDFCADVSDEAAVQAMFAEIRRTLGDPDILVNNAGVAWQKLFTDVTAAEWDAMFGVCVKGAFHCCQAVLPHMIRQKWGRIINVSSMWGQVGASCEAPYSAAKAALIGLTKALAKEEGPSGITVNCVAPGVIDTEMMAAFSAGDKAVLAEETPLGRLGTPEDVAAAVAFLASEAGSFFTGQVLCPNGGFVV
ncbi:MAG: 3-oxoacyl-ACP reductase FabG [Subdoligranulum sp.]|nr:3-oxoacyl-ACP reductase FabG [Subdoligranulum sp.]